MRHSLVSTMAVEDYPAININLFQVQADPGEFEVIQGIALRELTPGEFFVDPQNDYGHPTTVTDGNNLILGVSEALALPVQHPVGNVALVGLAQREGLTLTRVFPDHYQRTRELHTMVMSHGGEDQRGHLAKLVLLSDGGELHVGVRGLRRPSTYTLQYIERDGGFIVINKLGGDDEGGSGGGSGPNPDDRAPRTPITPVSSAGAAAELPPETEEKPLQAIGRSC
jgi:hypothetical protein